MWYVEPDISKAGDYSAPVLYAVGYNRADDTRGSWMEFLRKHPYLKAHPTETRWESVLRLNRAELESIIATEGEANGGEPWTTVTPWIAPPDHPASHFNDQNGQTLYTATADDVNRQMGLLKSKAIPEILIWNPVNRDYDTIKKVYDQVYDPYLVSLQETWPYEDTELLAAHSSSGSQYERFAQVARITDTNERWSSSPYTPAAHVASILSTLGGPSSEVRNRVTAVFDAGVSGSAFPTDEMLRVTLEVQVEARPPGETELADINDIVFEGTLGFDYHDDGDSLVNYPLTFGTEGGSAQWYRFWAPREHTGTEEQNLRVLMRRTFDIPASCEVLERIIDSNGEGKLILDMHVVGSSFATDTEFQVDWDLVQLTRAPRTGPPCAIPPYELERGLTFNHNNGPIDVDGNTTAPRLASLWNLHSGTIGGEDPQDVVLEFIGAIDPDGAAPVSVIYEAWVDTDNVNDVDEVEPVEVSQHLDFSVGDSAETSLTGNCLLLKPKATTVFAPGRYIVTTWPDAESAAPRLLVDGTSDPVAEMSVANGTQYVFTIYGDCGTPDAVADCPEDPLQLCCGWGVPQFICDTIDFNGDSLFPDSLDVDDYMSVFSGGPCSNDPNCGDIDYNNDGLYPDSTDLDALLSIMAGGPCLWP